MSELKPCPFCGGKGHLSQREIRFIGQNYYGAKKIYCGVQVICGRCHARGGLATDTVVFGSYDYESEHATLASMNERAVDAWNQRKGEQT